MDSEFESSGSPPSAPTLSALRGLLEISRLTRQEVPIRGVLKRIAAIVGRELGFSVVTINEYRPDSDSYLVVAVHGPARARELLVDTVVPAATVAPLLDPRFDRHGVYVVPAGACPDEPDITWYRAEPRTDLPSLPDEVAWSVEDVVVTPLIGTQSRNLGLMWVDEPVDGRRPHDGQLEMLAVFAAHAALAIESSRQLQELETSLARNRAVLSSSLDCVIAMDRRGVVTDFNPAAERTFGYSSAEAIGRDLATLVVPEPERETARRRFIAGLGPDGDLLGRRAEMTVMRSDGSQLPIEFAVACVPDGEDLTYYGFVRDISERRRTEAELAYLAYHDSLTGLPNRAQVEQQLDLALARSRRSGTAVALMFIDLDDFKAVNDQLGHAVGDRFLAEVASRLRAVLRDSDVLARQGGDEFLVVLADLGEDAGAVAESVAGKLLDALRDPIEIAGQALRTAASIGISLYPEGSQDVPALLRHADAAMYRAKSAGGGRLVCHRPGQTPVGVAGGSQSPRGAAGRGSVYC